MTSSYTQNLGLQQPATGDQTNSWGPTVNTDWAIVDNAIAGLASINLPAQSGYPTVVLTFSQGSSTQQLPNRRLDFIGALTANTLVLFPQGRNAEVAVTNTTSGAFSLTLGVNNNSGGALSATVVVAQGATMELFSDGTNIAVRAVTGPSLAVSGNLPAFADATGSVLKDSGAAPTSLVPTGTILPFATAVAPSGYLNCDGSSYSTSTYSALFSLIGYTFGGSGSSFAVPDLRGRVIAGWDSGDATGRLTASTSQGVSAASIADVGGEQAHTQTNTELVSHSHSATSTSTSTSTSSVNDPAHAHAYYSNNAGSAGTNNPPLSSASGAENQAFSTTPAATGISVSTSTSTTTSTTVSADGGGAAFNVVQPTIILNYIIKI